MSDVTKDQIIANLSGELVQFKQQAIYFRTLTIAFLRDAGGSLHMSSENFKKSCDDMPYSVQVEKSETSEVLNVRLYSGVDEIRNSCPPSLRPFVDGNAE